MCVFNYSKFQVQPALLFFVTLCLSVSPLDDQTRSVLTLQICGQMLTNFLKCGVLEIWH